jgi:hypothetical protein
VGLGEQIAARQQFTFNLHHINTTTGTLLREVWLNAWYINDADLKAPIVTFAGTGNPADMSIPAGQHVQRGYSCTASGVTRIISLYGPSRPPAPQADASTPATAQSHRPNRPRRGCIEA